MCVCVNHMIVVHLYLEQRQRTVKGPNKKEGKGGGGCRGKLKGLLRERENPYQTSNSWVSLSLNTLELLFRCCVCVFLNVCPPRSDAVLLYGKISL